MENSKMDDWNYIYTCDFIYIVFNTKMTEFVGVHIYI